MDVRPPIERMRCIAVLLRLGTPFTATEIADRFEVTRKTITHDIAFMRDRLGWDFSWNGKARRYQLNKAPTPVL